MPQYLIYAHDGTDEQALARRLAARPTHLEGVRELKEAGHFITGGALLNEAGDMIGSMMVMDFPDRAQLDAWLHSDAYTTGSVWEKVVVHPFRIAGV